MICRVQNHVRNASLCLKPSTSLASFHASVWNHSTAVSCLSELSGSSSQAVKYNLGCPDTRKSGIDVILAKVCNRSSDDEVFCSLTHDQTCNTMQPSHDLVGKLLQRFKDDWKCALGIFRWAASSPGYKHLSESCDTMVDILGKAKKWDKMKEVLQTTQKDNLVSYDTIAKAMRRFCGAGKWEDAVRMFDELGNFGLEKNTESMNLLLDTLCKENRVEQARSVFLELKSHIPPNARTFNIFVHGWCKVNRVDEAHWTIQEMKGHGYHPCVISYSTIIQFYCRQCNFAKVYELLDEMEAQGCPPNSVTYTTIICFLTRSEEFEEALQVTERMRASGCKPDTRFYNCLIHTLARAGRIKEAVRVFEVEMPESDIPASTSTYNTIIAMFCHNNQDSKAFRVLEEIESSKVCKPDVHTYYPLLKLCFKRGKMDDLKRLLGDMVNKHHLSLDNSTYTLLVHGFCGVDRSEWAYLLFEEMIDQDIIPRYRTCRLLLEEVRQKNMHEAAERIEEFMKNV